MMLGRSHGLRVALVAITLHVVMIALFELLGRFATGESSLATSFRDTNIPFLIGWAGVAAVVARREKMQLHWTTRAESERQTWPFAFVACALLAFLYADAVVRCLETDSRAHATSRIVEAVVLAPLVEEALFRGILWEACRRWTRGRGAATAAVSRFVITSLAFAVWHIRLSTARNLIGHALFGLAMACVRQASGRLAPCVALHALGNALTLVYE